MTTIVSKTAFGFDKNITIDNLDRFNGKYEMMPGFAVNWDVRKGEHPAGLAITRWDVEVFLRGHRSVDIERIVSSFIVWDRETPEHVYHKAMECIITMVSELNIKAMNNQTIKYQVND